MCHSRNGHDQHMREGSIERNCGSGLFPQESSNQTKLFLGKVHGYKQIKAALCGAAGIPTCCALSTNSVRELEQSLEIYRVWSESSIASQHE